MNTLARLCALALAAHCGLAAAADMGFKQLPFGATMAEVQKSGKLFCRPDLTRLSDTRCMFEDPAKRTYAGQFSDELWLSFIGGKLDSFVGQFGPGSFDAIRDAMQEKYGVGTCETSPAPSCTWTLSSGEALLFHKGRTLYLTVGSASGKAERARRMNEAQARIKRDV